MPLYHAPLAGYQIDEEMAQSQLRQAQAQEAGLKVQQLKKAIADKSAVDKLKTSVYNKINQQVQAPQGQGPNVTQNLMPGESGGMPTDMPGFQTTDFWKGMGAEQAQPQPMAQQPMAPMQPAQESTNIAQNLSSSMSNFDNLAKQIRENEAMISELRSKGYHDEADRYADRNLALQDKARAAHKELIDSSIKTMDIAGSLANGYLKAIEENPQAEDMAWGRFVTQMQMNGIPSSDLGRTPRDLRAATAQQILNEAEGGKERAMLQREQLRQLSMDNRAKASNALRAKSIALQDRSEARKRSNFETKRNETLDQNEYKNNQTKLNTLISSTQRDRQDVEQQIDDISMRLNGLRTGTILTDSGGAKLTKDARMAEVEMLTDQLTQLEKQRQNLNSEVDDYQSQLKSLKLKPGSRETAPIAGSNQPKPKADKNTLPESARAQLRENVNTTFANGQTWTLMDGKAVRVK